MDPPSEDSDDNSSYSSLSQDSAPAEENGKRESNCAEVSEIIEEVHERKQDELPAAPRRYRQLAQWSDDDE